MMTLPRYIAKNIFSATSLAALIILSVLFILLLLGEAKNIGEGDYGLTAAFWYVFLRLPNEFYRFSPMLILLGCMMGLSSLSSYRELAVMRASGFSIACIILSTLASGLLLVAILSFFGEGFAPELSSKAQIHKENTRYAGQAVITSSGAWLHVGNNFIHIERAVGGHRLEGVTRYEFDAEHHLLAAYYADSMQYQQKQWKMVDGVKTIFHENKTESQHFAAADWDLNYNPNFLKFGTQEPAEMSLKKLANYSHYLKKNHLQFAEYRYEFWQRVLQPLASLLMVLLAIPFVLSTFKHNHLGMRIVIGIMVGFSFFIANAFLGQLSIVYQIPAVLAASLPIFIFAGVGIFLCKRLLKY
jgi:lipopolysaccharide export system permease protein